MMQPGAKAEKSISYPKPIDFRKSIDGLAALIEGDIKVVVGSFQRSRSITESVTEDA